jgi:hypothetical protein
LKILFPEAFTERGIDFEVLKSLLGALSTSATKSTDLTGMANAAPGNSL